MDSSIDVAEVQRWFIGDDDGRSDEQKVDTEWQEHTGGQHDITQ